MATRQTTVSARGGPSLPERCQRLPGISAGAGSVRFTPARLPGQPVLSESRQVPPASGIRSLQTEPELSGGVVKFRLKNLPTRQAYDLLWKRHRLAIAMTGGGDSEGLRFSPHIYNTVEEIDRAMAAVGELSG